MIFLLFNQNPNIAMALGVVFTFLVTFIMLKKGMDRLPADAGRDFAVDGKLSKGKPQGAGLFFIISFVIACVLFSPAFCRGIDTGIELSVYLILIFLEMLTGYLDDRSDVPWGRTKKGLLDLFVSFAMAANYVYYQGSDIIVMNQVIEAPILLVLIAVAFMAWVSINVTNCADGVDGLSGTLVLITIISFLVADYGNNFFAEYRYFVVFFIATLLAYLWFNAGPSILLMGDAGSRAMGIFICITALKSKHPIMFLFFALVIILDGGLGLFKVTIIKLTKKKDFMNKIRTPLHDHVRKNLEVKWSNNQCVTRFAILQTVISIVAIYIFMR